MDRCDGEGKGAFYDHYTVQKSKNHSTTLVRSTGTPSNLHVFAKQQTYNLPYGIEDNKTRKNLPLIKEEFDEKDGLLFIPGRIRGQEDQERKKFEFQIIRQARLQERPILTVCAGMWRLSKLAHQ